MIIDDESPKKIVELKDDIDNKNDEDETEIDKGSQDFISENMISWQELRSLGNL